MDESRFHTHEPFSDRPELESHEIIVASVVPEPPAAPPRQPARRSVKLPLLLFVATCLSTLLVGSWLYALAIMTILLCHEMGHFLQAKRYHVQASLPYFIPMPFSPIGTMGAVIAMRSNMGDRRALFDIGITGPLAGLIPTLICCVVGLHLSHVAVLPRDGSAQLLGEPLLFKWLGWIIFGALPAGQDVVLHPVAFAGWVGLLITALNLIPIGQLDGGHILYGLLLGKARHVASFLFLAALAAVLVFGYYGWILMLMLVALIGTQHPPTANDQVPLGAVRIVLGWLTLALVPIGFTPAPFAM